MIPLERLLERFGELQRGELERWIAEDLVRPERSGTDILFGDIDLARVRLLIELRHELHLDEEALPVVMSLMDQLYATRRHMRLLVDALDRQAPELQASVIRELRRRSDPAQA